MLLVDEVASVETEVEEEDEVEDVVEEIEVEGVADGVVSAHEERQEGGEDEAVSIRLFSTSSYVVCIPLWQGR